MTKTKKLTMNLKQIISLFGLLIGMNNCLSAMQASIEQVKALEGGIDALNQRLQRFEQTSADLPKAEGSSIPNDEDGQAEKKAAKAAEFFKKQKEQEQRDQLEAAKADAAQSKEKAQSLTTQLYLTMGSMGTIIAGLSGWLLHATSTVNMHQLATNMNQLVEQHLAVMDQLMMNQWVYHQLANGFLFPGGVLVHTGVHDHVSTGVMAIIAKLFIR